jgi:hypothetical protein
MKHDLSDQHLRVLVMAHFELSTSVPEAFFVGEVAKITEACRHGRACPTALQAV